MNHSPLLNLPREIRDLIYAYVLTGIGQSIHQTPLCSPVFYLHSSCSGIPGKSKTKTPDVAAVTARDHPLLATCRQLHHEGMAVFLAKNTFCQDVLAPGLLGASCKALGLFVKGLGEWKFWVKEMGLRVVDPGMRELDTALGALITLARTQDLRPGAVKLWITYPRPGSPALFSARNECWSISPKDENTLTLELVIDDPEASWRAFEQLKDRDRNMVNRGTERILGICAELGMQVGSREREWGEERTQWWERTWELAREKFEGVVGVMLGLEKGGLGGSDCD